MKAYKAIARHLAQVPGLVVLGHYCFIPAAVITVAMRVAAVVSGYLACYLIGALLLPVLAALVAHGGGICTHGGCAVLISATPTDAVQRYRWWLWHTHHQLKSRVTWALLAVWFVLTFVIVNPILSAVPIVAFLAVELRALRLHSRLRPWCPWCGRGGGDHGPIEPTPTGGLSKPAPREKVNA